MISVKLYADVAQLKSGLSVDTFQTCHSRQHQPNVSISGKQDKNRKVLLPTQLIMLKTKYWPTYQILNPNINISHKNTMALRLLSLCARVASVLACALTRVNVKAQVNFNERSTWALPVYGSVLWQPLWCCLLSNKLYIGVLFLYRTPQRLKLPAVMSQMV